jgi:hypothetical protein
MSITSQISTVCRGVTRSLRGEAVTLFNADGTISAEIPDAVVSIDPANAGIVGNGPADQSGVLRLPESYHATAKDSTTATVQTRTWNIVHVSEIKAGTFRVEIRTQEAEASGKHSNEFDLDGNQAVWYEAD